MTNIAESNRLPRKPNGTSPASDKPVTTAGTAKPERCVSLCPGAPNATSAIPATIAATPIHSGTPTSSPSVREPRPCSRPISHRGRRSNRTSNRSRSLSPAGTLRASNACTANPTLNSTEAPTAAIRPTTKITAH
jgi:hypothetical protein